MAKCSYSPYDSHGVVGDFEKLPLYFEALPGLAQMQWYA